MKTFVTPKFISFFKTYYSGLLTGKYKRGVKPDKSEGRVGVIAQDESKAMQSAPAWSQYDNNEEYWKLMEALEKCAKETGIFLFVYFGNSFSP